MHWVTQICAQLTYILIALALAMIIISTLILSSCTCYVCILPPGKYDLELKFKSPDETWWFYEWKLNIVQRIEFLAGQYQ